MAWAQFEERTETAVKGRYKRLLRKLQSKVESDSSHLSSSDYGLADVSPFNDITTRKHPADSELEVCYLVKLLTFQDARPPKKLKLEDINQPNLGLEEKTVCVHSTTYDIHRNSFRAS